MSKISDFLSSRVYIRAFVKVADSERFVKSYLKNFDATLEYVFSMPKLNNLQVIALVSPHGNISAVVTDSLDGFPEYLERTKTLYWTEDMEAILKAAAENGMKVLQKNHLYQLDFKVGVKHREAMLLSLQSFLKRVKNTSIQMLKHLDLNKLKGSLWISGSCC